MLYGFLRVVVRGLLQLINGNAHYEYKDRLPAGNYILVGPHRTWFEPIYYALAASPKKFSFMAKIELFKKPIIRFILIHINAFPVDRQNPGPSVIKRPVNYLKKTKLSLIMFPSGTRHSQKIKGGVAVIAKMAKVPIVPTVYQGPLTFKKLFSRQQVTIAFGDPIQIDDKYKLDDNSISKIEFDLQTSFYNLDKQINPNFNYIDSK